MHISVFSAELVKRHAGVLGLGACVLSSPYDVPTWMPQLLMNLSAHLNDPQPIEVKFFLVSFFAYILSVILCKKPLLLVTSSTFWTSALIKLLLLTLPRPNLLMNGY